MCDIETTPPSDRHSVHAKQLNISLQRKINALSRDYEVLMQRRFRKLGYSSDALRNPLLAWLDFAVKRHFFSHYFGAPPAWRVAIRSRFRPRTTPDFCVIGPIKSGTSDIAATLLLHPCVTTPLCKEIWSNEFWRIGAYYPTARKKEAQRLKYGVCLSPYLTPALHLVDFAYKLARINAHMRVVITLRNPVWRLYSHWKWEVFLAGNDKLCDTGYMRTFDEYVDKSLDLYPCTPMYTGCGAEGLRTSIYWQAVKCWQDVFGVPNVLVVESDEYFREKMQFMHKVQDFVGLPRESYPSLQKPLNQNPLKLPPPAEETIERLKVFFRPHNDALWRLIGQQFDW